ncbi:murein hydrolase activator EnvC family protein [Pseudaestuariivita rosea]|uniref:murein hydrolase activator EnvC family protein n=1 Tax=Pseudaestuariivita rosea TaxID=2763263 RepID=UPI001ABB70DA|nr:peptidase M23 [Pseudaestuariivita rosea]
MILRATAFLCALIAAPAMADPAQQAETAAKMLSDAAIALENAEGARDRIAALTQTVQAYEAGLAAMRDSLREVTLQQQALRLKLDASEQELSDLLTVMQKMGQVRGPVGLLHPSGPKDTARAGMLLSALAPHVQTQAEMLRDDLVQIETLRALQDDAVKSLQSGLGQVQTARTALAQAAANRSDLPSRFAEDPVRTAILLDASETLSAFSSGLISGTEDDTTLPRFAELQGTLNLPVQGRIRRVFNEADAAGVARPGWLIETQPAALVVTPVAATIRYNGPLLTYGTVVILEPAADSLLILTGLDQTFGSMGDVLPAGAPVGLMGGTPASDRANLTQIAEVGSVNRLETLYIEVRHNQTPVDPALWFQVIEE